MEVTKDGSKILCTRRHRVRDVVSMGVVLLRLGIRLQAISFDHTVRISRHLLLNIFRTPTLFTHALVPSVFRLQVSVMIQESSSKFFPTELGIREPRPATHRPPLTGGRAYRLLSRATSWSLGDGRVRQWSCARASFSLGDGQRRRCHFRAQEFPDTAEVIGQSAGHGRGAWEANTAFLS